MYFINCLRIILRYEKHAIKFKLRKMSSYSLTPLKLGAEVHGINLQSDVSADVLTQIKSDVTKHRVLVFKDQGIIEGRKQVQISKWFGDVISTFYRHPKSPDLDVFRVSNDEKEGCLNVGRTGWHIDGSFLEAPYSYSIYHIISVPKQGDTVFLPLTELIDGLTCTRRSRWERLWIASARRQGVTHPLIYSHPITKKKVLCFHLGMTEAYIWNYGCSNEKMTSYNETLEIHNEIYSELTRNNNELLYSHKWEAGDFIISDNLAVGHEASPETQYPVNEVGLRVMHRTTVAGTSIPTKLYQLTKALQCSCGKCDIKEESH